MPFCPQGQSQVSGTAGSGRFAPHSGQKRLRMPFCPQGQSQVSGAGGSGRFAPHSGQKRLRMPFCPQGQSQPVTPAACCMVSAACAVTGLMASRVMPITLPMAPRPTPSCIISPVMPATPPAAPPLRMASRPT